MLRKAQFRFAHLFLISAFALCQQLIDINTASERDVAALPQIGKALAKKIIKNRPYASIDDLARADVPAQTRELLKSRSVELLKGDTGASGRQPAGRMTPAERAQLNENLAKLSDALFDYGKATVSKSYPSSSSPQLSRFARSWPTIPIRSFLVRATPTSGCEEYNVALGDRRAPRKNSWSHGYPNESVDCG